MRKSKNLNVKFQNKLNYMLTNLEKDILLANKLEEKQYVEMSKNEIIEALNYVYENIKDWPDNYNKKDYKLIIDSYNEMDSIISQLELCLSEYDDQFHMEGISYSMFLIGKSLSNIIRRSANNVREKVNNKSNNTKK